MAKAPNYGGEKLSQPTTNKSDRQQPPQASVIVNLGVAPDMAKERKHGWKGNCGR